MEQNFCDLPSAFSITLALFPSMTATHELVVPKSIPMILSKKLRSLLSYLRCKVSLIAEKGSGVLFFQKCAQHSLCFSSLNLNNNILKENGGPYKSTKYLIQS